ncbi:autotransporter outer membrane beta-barrel domain-containing protein [Falsochrobactrum sp. TDYN1]|uniref:Autotransporter outer membrane beta-barrel domain-containing protein n=1 Tax=Falsochrobactrum tianjinense TaxID=2706015 RepID=A0A949UUR6_9HYPH|nr:autotransporter outer membrane beta-barrel domain-containing protein [Falsochrobactrum sp. TDYN1]MBV2143353.1 autotransporter outer membrane beta-barrel domain-containing protein [Falsochrobactrum sp. TDYN1]
MSIPGYKKRETTAASAALNLRSGVSTLALLGAFIVSGGAINDAHAASYLVATESDLIAAINSANADGDAASTITLTGNVTLANPSAIPSITKSLTINTGSFAFSATGDTLFDTADGETLTLNGNFAGTSNYPQSGILTKEGGGTTVYTGSSTYTGNYFINDGFVEFRDGAQFNTASLSQGTTVSAEAGSTARLLVTGPGTAVYTGLQIGGGANSHSVLEITDGGVVQSSDSNSISVSSSGKDAGIISSVIVDGAGSLLHLNGDIFAGYWGDAFFNVTDGGVIRSKRIDFGGHTFLKGKFAAGVVTGKGSTWESSGTFGLFSGSLNVLDRGQVTSATFSIAGSGGVAEALVSDAGSSLATTTGDITLSTSGQGVLTVVQDGKVTVKGGTGSIKIATAAAGRGVLNIGGKEGEAAQSAGVIEAATIAFGSGNGIVNFNHTNSGYDFTPVFTGAGTINHAGSGKTILDTDNSAFTGVTNVNAGTLAVNNVLGGTMNVSGGRLQGIGTVGTTTHEAEGVIAPGNSIGTLTIDGDYIGNGGLVEIETVLGDDSSSTDLLHIMGNTSGTGDVRVINLGGTGAPTTEGIKIIEVGGTSDGVFSLKGDYALDGDQVVVAGAYAYRLLQNGVSTPTDGDWYLRSTLKPVDPDPAPTPEPDPAPAPTPEPQPATQPLYQAGAPIYEAYPQTLMALNSLPTLKQRVGNRYWSYAGNRMIVQGADAIIPYAPAEEAGIFTQENGVWGRIEGAHNRFKPDVSTTDAAYDVDVFKLQAGLDGMLHETANGKLIGGITVHYGHGSTDIFSPHGNGEISTDGYGFGGTLTWYGENGFYLDGQAQVTWYRSDLSSDPLGIGLADGNHGFGYALSLESGKRIQINEQWSWTPQGQLIYSSVDFDSFYEPFGEKVSLHNGDSLQGRLGLSFDRQNAWQNSKGLTNRIHSYGIGNLYYEFLDGVSVELAETRLTSRNERLWGGIGLGGSYNWDDDKYSLYGEASINTSLNNFGDSYNYKGNIGFRVKW